MAWDTSNRRTRLPSNWASLVANTKRLAGGQCQHTNNSGTRCPAPGTECDHITRGDDHSQANLQWLCAAHHLEKTQAESAAARAANRRKLKHPSAHRKHPGLA